MKPKQKTSIDRRAVWVSEVTIDAVKHFVWGIGDNNPLWLDKAYASNSQWGEIIAPPSFAYAINETTVAPGMEGYERHYQSVDWEWFFPFKLGDLLTSESQLLEERPGSSPGVIEQRGQTEFFDSSSRLIARSIVTCRRDNNPLPSINDRVEIRYSSDELLDIEERVISELPQGSTSRYGDELLIGDSVGTITKGPLSIMDIVAWCAGTKGAPDDSSEYSSGGLDSQSATGPQVVAWIINLVSNWMGDTGVLKRLSTDIEILPFLGSTTTISGNVVKLTRSDSGYISELSLSCYLQNNELIATSSALIELPNKESYI